MVRWQLLPEMRNIFYLARLVPPDLCTSFRWRYGDVNLPGYSWSGWAELTEKPNAHLITEKINQKKISTGRSSLSLRVWLLDTVAGLQPADFNTSHSFIFIEFSVSDSKMGLFHFASCFHPNWNVLCFKSNRQSLNHILSYQMWYTKFPAFTQRDPLTAVRLDITWGLIQGQSMNASWTRHRWGYVLVKYQKAFRTEKTLCHCRSVRTSWTWAS